MIKKISIYLILIFFSTNLVAQDLIMKCGEHTYKYISDPSGDKVLYKILKELKISTKNGAKNQQNQCWVEKVGLELLKIIKDMYGQRTKYPNNIERTNSVSGDFIKLTRHIEWYHTKSGDKKT